MNFSLIICTYMRPGPLVELLKSVQGQDIYPNEILIIDGSLNTETEDILEKYDFAHLKYFKVDQNHRGLTKQRNYGIELVNSRSEVICFLDDDIVLKSNYFSELIRTYEVKPDALAVGGYIDNNKIWNRQKGTLNTGKNKFCYDGWERDEPSRFKLRRLFGLLPDTDPGFFPTFAHGRSVGFLPPSGKIYDVEQIMGGVSSYKKEVFDNITFSNYFEGYGLYEDADFSLRLAKKGKLYVNTRAQLFHYHDHSGRPNKFKYGKMVVRNGWYVWRVKYPSPNLKARIKWHATSFLLTVIRVINIVNTQKRKEALTEALGRIVGWVSLFFNRPRIES